MRRCSEGDMQVATVMEIRPSSQTDQELIDQCVDGHRREFVTIFRRHSRIVYAVAITVLRNPAEAEDVVSDTFLTLWRKSATVNFIDDSALPWLIATA